MIQVHIIITFRVIYVYIIEVYELNRVVEINVEKDNLGSFKAVTIPSATIRAYHFSRLLGSDFLNRLPERKSGVYLLYGRNLGDNAVHLYIGLIENLQTGSQNLQFSGSLTCRDAIAFTDSNRILNRSQLKYLKFYLLHMAKQAANVVLDNMNDSLGCNISVNDKVVADSFLADLLLILKALDINFFDLPVPDVDLSCGFRFQYQRQKTLERRRGPFPGRIGTLIPVQFLSHPLPFFSKGGIIKNTPLEYCRKSSKKRTARR